MNFAECANCLLHGWKPEEGQRTLQRCSKCKVIQYCGRECQAEHWERVHKKMCKYFADPVKAQKFGHNEENCSLCIEAAKVGKAEICRATNPNYECILKTKFPPGMYHSHPFPVSGQPGDTREKAIIVLWQLLEKLELTQPGVIARCQGKFFKVVSELAADRLEIWRTRKITASSYRSDLCGSSMHNSIKELLDTIRGKVWSDESTKNLVQIIELVYYMLAELNIHAILLSLKDPLADMPAVLHTIVSQVLSNSTIFPAMANQLLDALTAQVVPYKDLLRIVCGGSLVKTCSFCQKNTTILKVGHPNPDLLGNPFVIFEVLVMEIYCCGTPNCHAKAVSIWAYISTNAGVAITTTHRERLSTRCDFCSKLPARGGGHRCSKCCTVMYCSVDCRDQDSEIHKEFCREEAEERKKKLGGSGRRKEARGALDKMEKFCEEIALEKVELSEAVQEGYEVVTKFKLKDAPKKAKK